MKKQKSLSRLTGRMNASTRKLVNLAALKGKYITNAVITKANTEDVGQKNSGQKNVNSSRNLFIFFRINKKLYNL